jgi:hypothetical protein
MNVFVGIATSGRRESLAHAIDSVRGQECQPDLIVVSVPQGEHARLKHDTGSPQIVGLQAPKGSCAQRNAILDYFNEKAGVLLIIDDDFILHKSYLRLLRRFMEAHRDVAILNGKLVADGICGPGLSAAQAERLLADVAEPDGGVVIAEDCACIYFSARLKDRGRVVKANIVAGVHLGVKSGRTAGVQLGYSQIVNPAYLVRKGTMNLHHALGLIFRNVAMNAVRSLKPEPYIDRRGRLVGNIKGCARIVRGQLDPRYVTKI